MESVLIPMRNLFEVRALLNVQVQIPIGAAWDHTDSEGLGLVAAAVCFLGYPIHHLQSPLCWDDRM